MFLVWVIGIQKLVSQYVSFFFRSDPMVHKNFAMTIHLQRKLGSRFRKTDLLDNLTEDVVHDENSYLPSADILLGLVTRNLLRKKVEDGDPSEGQRDKIIKAGVAFYRKSLQYTLPKIDTHFSSW